MIKEQTPQSMFPVSVEQLTVTKRGTPILKDVSFQLQAPGFTMVMGPNGCGKTTLLKCLHGLERARIKWNIPDKDAQKKQSFVFQSPVLMRRTVLENIAYPLKLRGMSKTIAYDRAKAWTERVGLSKHAIVRASDLSGGERQKLSLARALISEPELLFLDEPTTNLDGTSTREIEELLLGVAESGTRIIMATHDLGQAKRLASEVIFLNRGSLCEHQSAADFFKSPKTEAARAYLKGDIVE